MYAVECFLNHCVPTTALVSFSGLIFITNDKSCRGKVHAFIRKSIQIHPPLSLSYWVFIKKYTNVICFCRCKSILFTETHHYFHRYNCTMYMTRKKFLFNLICAKIISHENVLHEYLLDKKANYDSICCVWMGKLKL